MLSFFSHRLLFFQDHPSIVTYCCAKVTSWGFGSFHWGNSKNWIASMIPLEPRIPTFEWRTSTDAPLSLLCSVRHIWVGVWYRRTSIGTAGLAVGPVMVSHAKQRTEKTLPRSRQPIEVWIDFSLALNNLLNGRTSKLYLIFRYKREMAQTSSRRMVEYILTLFQHYFG
jgi:hypothetical protein